MSHDIDKLIDTFAAHLAHKRGQAAAELRPFVEGLVAEAMQEYYEAGAPYGPSEHGFLRWLGERPVLAMAAKERWKQCLHSHSIRFFFMLA